MSVRDSFTLVLIVLMSFFLMCDIYITPAILPDLTAEYGVSSVQLSMVSSAFILIGAAISIYIGYKTDSVSRKKLMLLVVLIGELPCLLTGIYFFTETFTGFLILRVLTGIGVGGIYPLTFSLLGDYFQEKYRARASAFVDIAWGLGTIAGPILATYAITTDYGWRLAFLFAALPNFPLALLFYCLAREPERGRNDPGLRDMNSDHPHFQYRIQLSDFRMIFSSRTNLLVFLQGIPGSIPWGLFPFWLIVIFTDDGRLTRESATFVWEVFGIATAVGGLAWAFAGDRLFLKKPAYLPMLCSIGILVGIVPSFLLFNQSSSQWMTYIMLASLAGAAISVASSNSKAILLNVNRPEHRGTVFALYNLGDNIGKGLGPAIGGLLYTLTGSYTQMSNWALSLWILTAVLYFGVVRSIGADRQRLVNLLQSRVVA